jgi:hypothetical protein
MLIDRLLRGIKMYMWQKETAFGRTREEALSNLDAIMMRKHPDEPYTRDMAEVFEYGDKKSEFKFIAEVKF